MWVVQRLHHGPDLAERRHGVAGEDVRDLLPLDMLLVDGRRRARIEDGELLAIVADARQHEGPAGEDRETEVALLGRLLVGRLPDAPELVPQRARREAQALPELGRPAR